METQTTKKKIGKIVFYTGCVFSLAAVVCLMVGGPMYYQERSKERRYVKELCFVQSSSYKTIERCKLTSGSDRHVGKCFLPVWQITYGQNGTRTATIQGDGEPNYWVAEAKSDKYQTGSSHPCWYNSEKPLEATWYQPSSYASVILLICGGILTLLAIVTFITAYCLRDRPDL